MLGAGWHTLRQVAVAWLYIHMAHICQGHGKSGRCSLQTADHPLLPPPPAFRVEYFNWGGASSLNLEWEGPQTGGRQLLSSDYMSPVQM